jgi:uncharacterized HAD superfamily protein
MMKTVIVDIDGTIADNSHRQHHLMKERKDWKSYNATMHLDTPIEKIVDLVNMFGDADCEIVLCTGREECFMGETKAWLEWHCIPYHKLLMRPLKDYRADEIVKLELLDKLLAEKERDIWLVIDDRRKVVDAWRARGLLCMQVAPGEF